MFRACRCFLLFPEAFLPALQQGGQLLSLGKIPIAEQRREAHERRDHDDRDGGLPAFALHAGIGSRCDGRCRFRLYFGCGRCALRGGGRLLRRVYDQLQLAGLSLIADRHILSSGISELLRCPGKALADFLGPLVGRHRQRQPQRIKRIAHCVAELGGAAHNGNALHALFGGGHVHGEGHAVASVVDGDGLAALLLQRAGAAAVAGADIVGALVGVHAQRHARAVKPLAHRIVQFLRQVDHLQIEHDFFLFLHLHLEAAGEHAVADGDRLRADGSEIGRLGRIPGADGLAVAVGKSLAQLQARGVEPLSHGIVELGGHREHGKAQGLHLAGRDRNDRGTDRCRLPVIGVGDDAVVIHRSRSGGDERKRRPRLPAQERAVLIAARGAAVPLVAERAAVGRRCGDGEDRPLPHVAADIRRDRQRRRSRNDAQRALQLCHELRFVLSGGR